MRNGDLSNSVTPRFIFVFEGLVALLPEDDVKFHRAYLRTHRWKRAAALWEFNEKATGYIWDITWRHDYRVDIVTFLKAGLADALRKRVEEENLPVSHFIQSPSAEAFARRLVYYPDVVTVFDPDPQRQFTWGGRGAFINPDFRAGHPAGL